MVVLIAGKSIYLLFTCWMSEGSDIADSAVLCFHIYYLQTYGQWKKVLAIHNYLCQEGFVPVCLFVGWLVCLQDCTDLLNRFPKKTWMEAGCQNRPH